MASVNAIVPRRTLGWSGEQVSALGLGSYHTYDRMPHDELVELVRVAAAAGLNWFDLGHYVSSAHPDDPVSQTDLRFAAARDDAGLSRHDFFHVQKVWYGGSHLSFRDQLALSLPRARVDHADCVIYNPGAAYDNAQPIVMTDIVERMAELIDAGLTRYWGVNQAHSHEIDRACSYAAERGLPLPVILQEPYNVIQRRMCERPDKVAVMTRWQLALQPTNVLAVGILAGRPAAAATRPLGPDVLTAHAEKVAEHFAHAAAAVGASRAQLAIAFALANPHTACVLFGASNLTQLHDNLGALALLDRLGADGVRDAVSGIDQNPDELDVELSSTSS